MSALFPSSFRLSPASRQDLDAMAARTGLSKTELVENAVKMMAETGSGQGQLTLSLPTTANIPGPTDTALGVAHHPQEPIDTGAPEWQLWQQPMVLWNPVMLQNAKVQADQGNMELCSDLWESMLADDRISGALEQRILASESLPLSFVGSPRGAKKLETLWLRMMSPGLRAEMFRRGLGTNVVPVYVRRWEDGQPVEVEVWSSRWLRYYWWERRWKLLTMSGIIDLESQPGRWYLFCPFGGDQMRPWVSGLWYSMATWWLLKSYSIPDWANFGQQHASPKWFLSVMDGNATISNAAKAEAVRWLARIPQRSGMFVPYPFKVEQQEVNSTAWQSYVQEVDKANAALAQRILGHDASMDKDATHASGLTALDTKLALVRFDVDAEREFWRQGLITKWAEVNGIPGPTPYPDRDTTPPEDLASASSMQKTAADALNVLVSAGYDGQVDVRAYLGRYFPLLEVNGESDDTAPTDGIQLTTSEADTLSDECVVRLSNRGHTATLLSAPATETRSILSARKGKSEVTDFPQKGDNKKVSLRNSQWSVFDPEYASDLKENWPDIWGEGGNIKGNDQYRSLSPVVGRGGAVETDAEDAAVRLREAWGARHYGDHLLAGVVAQIKWFVVGELGESGMKAVIQEKKDKLKERKAKEYISSGPGEGLQLLLRAEKDTRAQAREALGYRDTVSDILLDENLTKTPVNQILRVLSEAKGYEDAKGRLLAAFPDIDRKKLRDMISGSLLLSLAAGRLTAGKEHYDAQGKYGIINLPHISESRLLLFDEGQVRRDSQGRFAPKGMVGTRKIEGKRVMEDGSPLPAHLEAKKLPPAWHDVFINTDPGADLQAIGWDAKGRSQYVYSDAHVARQAQAKFDRIEKLREDFPEIMRRNDVARRSDDPKVRDTADCLHVIAKTGLRPGSEADTGAEKQAYGATTLQARHVHVGDDGSVSLRFVGKKGVDLDIPIRDPDSARILKARKEAAGGDTNQKIFPNTNERRLNDAAHEYGGYKTKDFRTHHGTSVAYREVSSRPVPRGTKEYEKAQVEVAREVARELGNTPKVALECYVNPAVFSVWRTANNVELEPTSP